MDINKTGGPAFPSQTDYTYFHGMTLRDYFAAKALPVFLNNPETDWDQDVQDAYAVADKMLKAKDNT